MRVTPNCPLLHLIKAARAFQARVFEGRLPHRFSEADEMSAAVALQEAEEVRELQHVPELLSGLSHEHQRGLLIWELLM